MSLADQGGKNTVSRAVGNIIAAAMLGAVAFWIARALGIPEWRNWHSGDATDIAAFTAIAVLLLSRRPC